MGADDAKLAALLDAAAAAAPSGGLVQLPEGTRAIVCTRGRRMPRCASCGGSGARRLCDYPVVRANGKAGTCDRPLCGSCAVSVGPGRDYCPPHHRYEQKRAQRQSSAP
jgi:hypothetical protein